MPDFLDRMTQTTEGEEQIVRLLEHSGFDVIHFGQDRILDKQNTKIPALIKKMLVGKFNLKSHGPGFMIKFSPDLLCFSREKNIAPFFLDVKVSRTPIIFQAKANKVKEEAKLLGIENVNDHDIGLIEREAWDVYGEFFEANRLAVCYLAPYNPNLILTEWRSNIELLFRYDKNRNEKAAGSQTPHVNIHLGNMRPLNQFVKEEFGVDLDEAQYEQVLNLIKGWPIEKPNGSVNWTQFISCLKRYSMACPWLRGKFKDEQGGVMDWSKAIENGVGKRKAA